MIDLLKKIFGKRPEPASPDGKDAGVHDIRIATCALLLEMAHIDGEFSDEERERITSVLRKEYQLSDEYITALIKAAREELEGSVDLWQFASLINQSYSMEEKTRIIEMVWKIAYTDGKLDKHEDYLVRKLAKLLRLTHSQLIEAKLRTTRSLQPR